MGELPLSTVQPLASPLRLEHFRAHHLPSPQLTLDRRGPSSDSSTSLFQFYARGMFASPLITSWRGTVQSPDSESLPGTLRGYVWGAVAVVHSLLDWPLRNLSGGFAGCVQGCADGLGEARDCLGCGPGTLESFLVGLPAAVRLATAYS